MHSLIDRALRVNQANLMLGHESFVADGAMFVRNTAFPRIYDANHMAHVTAGTPAEIERLLARAEREYAHCAHRQFHADHATPPMFEARLLLEGYTRSESLVMLLEGSLRAEPRPFDMRPIDDDAAWAAFASLAEHDWAEYRERTGMTGDASISAAMSRVRRAKSPPVRYWLGYIDGEPRGYFSSWEGTEGVGQVEDLFVHPDWRRRGLATALIGRCVRDCRERGAAAVVIVADPTDTPMRMYAAMGFRPVAVKREYRKLITAEDAPRG